MWIGGAAIYVKDIEKACSFFKHYFAGRVVSHEADQSKGRQSCVIEFEERTRLELICLQQITEIPEKLYLGYRYIAINVGTTLNVFRITEQLQGDGFEIASEPRKIQNRYFSHVMDTEGNIIEITT